ncbi:hypothetical protein BU23DRAFT_587045 [Bimuria novae-zelandiae CBS 107.79]|uniref:PHD-type domain-containing protein n=1 Tax=Bimuria novae-zelandiae CBS 107.79 TaxID=1447943 RepID=A0A6A5VSH0_9PLEO|nr:hypothetical protein BU23DRAFT_587045 [Bimuria novae-zelandiae CBS 107.79]
MDPPNSRKPETAAPNRPNSTSGADSQPTVSTSTSHPTPKVPIPPPAWASQNAAASASNSGGPSFPQFSAATAEILKRLQANQGNATAGSAAFEAKRAEVLQNYVTSDKLPTPPPVAGSGRRGRGGRVGTPLKAEGGVGSTGSTPASGRGSGRGRGRGRGGGRGGKRKRAESVDSDDDSDISSSYTPLVTRTKSGRNVNKPVAFVPTIPEPTQSVKRRRSTKTILAAQCKICHRGTDPGNNRIVFCDSCSTAYHQYCHDPPISNEVVNVLEKEWLCGPCERSKQNVVEGTEGLTAAEGLSIDEKRAYFQTLSQSRLVSLLLHATIRHPELPVFPPNVHDLLPAVPAPSSSKPSIPKPVPQPSKPPLNGSTSGTMRSQYLTNASGSDIDPSEAQLLGEMSSHRPAPNHAPNGGLDQDDYDDGYNTDPPAHYPKPGNGVARTLRSESEDLQWLVDDNFEVFSHGWKGDGSGLGADGVLADAMGEEDLGKA